MRLKEDFKRISYVANVCRTENENAEIQSMLNELDSTIADMICEIYGIDDYEEMEQAENDSDKKYHKHLIDEIQDAHISYRKAINNQEDESVISSLYGEWVALKYAKETFEKIKGEYNE